MAEYVSPYGKFQGLAQRLERWRAQLTQPGGGPFYGGLVADVEVVLRFLHATEFAEWLRVNGDQEQARWAADILEALDRGEEYDRLMLDIEKAVPVAEGQAYSDAVEQAAKLGDRMRAVLVETGALDESDYATDPADLLRALLS